MSSATISSAPGVPTNRTTSSLWQVPRFVAEVETGSPGARSRADAPAGSIVGRVSGDRIRAAPRRASAQPHARLGRGQHPRMRCRDERLATGTPARNAGDSWLATKRARTTATRTISRQWTCSTGAISAGSGPTRNRWHEAHGAHGDAGLHHDVGTKRVHLYRKPPGLGSHRPARRDHGSDADHRRRIRRGASLLRPNAPGGHPRIGS